MNIVFIITGLLLIFVSFFISINASMHIINLEKKIKLLEIKQEALVMQISGEWEPADLRYIKKITKSEDLKEK